MPSSAAPMQRIFERRSTPLKGDFRKIRKLRIFCVFFAESTRATAVAIITLVLIWNYYGYKSNFVVQFNL